MTGQGRDSERPMCWPSNTSLRCELPRGHQGEHSTPPAPSPVEGETERPPQFCPSCTHTLGVHDISGCGICSCRQQAAHQLWPPASPAVGETRVEWGVQYELYTGGDWRPGYLELCNDREDAESRAQVIANRAPGLWRNPKLISRSVYERRSAWVPVTDKETR